jgi:hypothetical protein
MYCRRQACPAERTNPVTMGQPVIVNRRDYSRWQRRDAPVRLTVSGKPVRVGRVVSHMILPQGDGDGRSAHDRTRMTAFVLVAKPSALEPQPTVSYRVVSYRPTSWHRSAARHLIVLITTFSSSGDADAEATCAAGWGSFLRPGPWPFA